MAMTTGLPVWAEGDGSPKVPTCAQDLHDKCQKAGTLSGAALTSGLQVAAGADGARNQSQGQANALGGCAVNFSAAKEYCGKAVEKCGTACSASSTDATSCKKILSDMMASYDGQAISCQGQQVPTQGTADKMTGAQPQSPGGGMGAMGAGLIGAVAGGLLGYMLGKKDGKKEANKDATDGALQANGTIDCSKSDAYQYQDCNDYLANTCTQAMTSNTYGSDANCMNFGNRFCASSSSSIVPISSAPAVIPAGTPVAGATPPIGQPGEGVGTPFCQSVLAYNYCQTSGREQCPSCLQIANNQAAACVNNPALCLAQNSQDQINQAKTTCPTDPIFSNPAYVAGGAAVANQLAATQGGTSLPAVVLPQSVNGSSSAVEGATPASVSSGTASAAVSGATTGAATASASDNGASREGGSTGAGSAPSYANGGGANYVPSSVASMGGREVAMSGGAGATARNTASTSGGPASDVQGQFGPSVFAMGSQAIRQRCQAGKLNNCQ
jgi:hypothetical protein